MCMFCYWSCHVRPKRDLLPQKTTIGAPVEPLLWFQKKKKSTPNDRHTMYLVIINWIAIQLCIIPTSIFYPPALPWCWFDNLTTLPHPTPPRLTFLLLYSTTPSPPYNHRIDTTPATHPNYITPPSRVTTPRCKRKIIRTHTYTHDSPLHKQHLCVYPRNPYHMAITSLPPLT